MCVVSMVGDFYRDKWEPLKGWGTGPAINPSPLAPFPTVYPTQDVRKDVEALRKEVLEMKELLKRAIKYDEENGQPHCEQKDKIKFLKQVAEAVGISLDDVFKGTNDAS